MRKSVMVGFGLWLFAVVSVAAIAWIAIDRAGRQVTNVSATALAPTINGVQMPLIGAVAEVPLATTVSPVPVPVPEARRTTPAASRSASRAYVAVLTTDGGRVRAQCVNQKASLENGGYARPELGWQAQVVARDGRVLVIFGSASETIGVVAHCVNGRPRFEQRTQPVTGSPVPEPSLTALSDPTMSPLSAVPPSSPSSPAKPGVSPSLRAVSGSDGEPGSRFGQGWTTPASTPSTAPMVTPSVTPSITPADGTQAGGTQAGPLLTAEPDPAEVSTYVSLADQFCSDPQRASGWCQRWQALTPLERYTLVARWLADRQAADADAASEAASGAPSGGENGGRDHWRNRAGATPAN